MSSGPLNFGHAQTLYNVEDQASVWTPPYNGPDEMRRRASQYRDIARSITDALTVKALRELADEYEARADKAQAGEVDDQKG